MTPLTLAVRIRFTTEQLVLEANHTRNPLTEKRLRTKARQLMYNAPAAGSPRPEVRAIAILALQEAIDMLVDVITTRSERELEQGAPQ